VRRVVLSELRHRRSRTLALLAGILVATAAFTVLTATSRTQRLVARGEVAKSFRGSYDVLVRPRGSRTVLERRTGQVQPNFLSALWGGITIAQWRRIQRLPGVEVAAPIANVGYVLPTVRVPVDVSAAAGTRGQVLLRANVTWRSDRGLTRARDVPQYAYVTSNPLRNEPFLSERPDTKKGHYYHRFSLREYVPGRRRPASVCSSNYTGDWAPSTIYGPFTEMYRSRFGCYSRRTGTGRAGYFPLTRSAPAIEVPWAFPMLLTAIDPDSEARLTGLDGAMVSGRYLSPRDHAHLIRRPRDREDFPPRLLPVLAASRTYVDEQAELAVERLRQSATERWTRPFSTHGDNDYYGPLRFLFRQPDGPVVQHATVSAETAYRQLLRALQSHDYTSKYPRSLDVKFVPTVWRAGPTGVARRGDVLAPSTLVPDNAAWRNTGNPLSWAYVSPTARDDWFREVSHLHSSGAYTPRLTEPLLDAVGVFDPGKLGTAPKPGAAPLASLQPPLLTARDAAAASALGGRPLRPNGSIGGYLAQPPGLLTTLAGARAFGGQLFPDFHPERGISAVRVRVAGVTGIDALSRERIREAAERIAAATGLDVDITAGASGAPTAVDLPAGRFGRPALALSETWVRKGVAARVLRAVDRKSLLLFALILVVCALFVTNAAGAAVRARRSELGVLACLGWSTGRLFAVVLTEVALVGLAAGVLGGLLALPLAALVGVDASPERAALAVPAATGLALLAGLVPAARAARADPAAAVRPAVLEAGRAWRPRGVGHLALVNLVRTPGRTALGALSLAIGVCALTLLLAATIAFHDVLVGTLLGDAVAVRVRSTDYVAVIATVVLGVAAVADVLFLNLRERAAELATLEALGWDERALGRLVALEGVWIGALGALAGSLLGLAGAALFAGALPVGLLLTTLGAAAAGTLLAGAAALVPALWLRRMPTVPLLAGD
jgi:putative ABC transport system permease protein